MGFTGHIKKIIKPLVDVPTWMNYQQISQHCSSLFSFTKGLFLPEKAGTPESFEAALIRFNLTEADLVQRMKGFQRLQWLWMIFFLIGIFYSIYLFFTQAWRGFFPCLGFSTMILTQVFRYHFWIFQIKNRRLGYTFREWLNANFFGGNKI